MPDATKWETVGLQLLCMLPTRNRNGEMLVSSRDLKQYRQVKSTGDSWNFGVKITQSNGLYAGNFFLSNNRSIGIWASSEEKDGYFYPVLEMHRCKYVATTGFRSLMENQIQYCVVIQRAFLSFGRDIKKETNRIGYRWVRLCDVIYNGVL